jgi:hypothetical protein
MPNRILRDWTDSEKMNTLSFPAEVFFTRLMMKVDDYGCYSNNLTFLKSTLYPLKNDIREADISRWLDECQKAGLILLYDVEKRTLLMIKNFKQRLRNPTGKYPLPLDGHLAVKGRSDDGEARPPIETKRNDIETNGGARFDSTDYYQNGKQAFEEIQKDELFVEQLLRLVRGCGYQACNEITVMMAVKRFLTIEEMKKEFPYREKSEVRKHLINWTNKNASKFDEYARI